jgi:hypothetical protein
MNLWAAIMLSAGGIFAGGAATFAWSRVPIWRRMATPDFVGDFGETIRWTDKVQPALLVLAIVGTVAYAIGTDGAARLVAFVAAGAFIVTLIGSVAVMVPLQRRMISAPLTEAASIEEMRDRWFSGNLGRSVLATVAYLLAVAAVLVGTRP